MWCKMEIIISYILKPKKKAIKNYFDDVYRKFPFALPSSTWPIKHIVTFTNICMPFPLSPLTTTFHNITGDFNIQCPTWDRIKASTKDWCLPFCPTLFFRNQDVIGKNQALHASDYFALLGERAHKMSLNFIAIPDAYASHMMRLVMWMGIEL